jgi:electron transfer flavoprotein beta subunit
MKIIVGIKQVYDVDQIRIDQETREPVLDVPLKIDDLSKNALEEAVKLKEKHGGHIYAILINGPKAGEAVKEALAIGADEAYIVDTSNKEVDTRITSKIFSALVRKVEFDLILLGHASVDSYTGQLGPRVGEILGIPVITHVREIQVNDGKLIATRDLETEFEIVAVSMPALITVTNEINEPRLPSLSQILSARKKPIHTLTLEEVGIAEESLYVNIISNKAPRMERKRKIYEDEHDTGLQEMISDLVKEGVI